MNEVHALLSRLGAEEENGKPMTAWAAYLFSSKVIYRTLRGYGDAGHEWAIQRSWRRLTKQYTPRDTQDKVYPAKRVYAIARSAAQEWLSRNVACPRCAGAGCAVCHQTGWRWYEQPLDTVTHAPTYDMEHEALVRVELDEGMARLDAAEREMVAAAIQPMRLGWLAHRMVFGNMSPEVERAREDYRILRAMEVRRKNI